MTASLTLTGTCGEPAPRAPLSARIALCDDPSRAFVAGVEGGAVCIRSVAARTGEEHVWTRVTCAARERCTAFDVSPDASRAAVVLRDAAGASRLVIAPLDDGAPVVIRDVADDGAHGRLFVGDGDRVLVEHPGRGWALRDARDGRVVRALGPSAWAVASPRGDRVARTGVASPDGTVVCVETAAGRELARHARSSVLASCFSPDGSVLWSLASGPPGGATYALWRWDLARDEHHEVPFETPVLALLADAARDGVTLVGAALTPDRVRWDAAARTLRHERAADRGARAPAGFERFVASRDGARAAALMRGSLFDVDLSDGAVRGFHDRTAGDVTALRRSPDGRALAVGRQDGAMRVIDLATGATRVAFEGHTGAVLACLWSPDGRTLCTISRDETLRTWDPATGAEVGALTLSHARLEEGMQPAMSPEGTAVAWEQEDGLAFCDLSRGRVDFRQGPGFGRARVLGWREGRVVVFQTVDMGAEIREYARAYAMVLRAEALPARLLEGGAMPIGWCVRSEDGRYLLWATAYHRPGAWIWDRVAKRLVWDVDDSSSSEAAGQRRSLAVGARWVVEAAGPSWRAVTHGATAAVADDALVLWSVARREVAARVSLPAGERATALALSDDEAEVLVGTTRSRVLRYRVDG